MKYYYFPLSDVTLTSKEVKIYRFAESSYVEISQLVYNTLK